MGRFVYQPVPSDMEDYSKHGQIIADIFSGHISTNHNNVIISATKRIEGKLEDVFQIENNITEQKNVINNLDSDYYTLINSQYGNMLKDFTDIKIRATVIEGIIKHLKNGIGDADNREGTILFRLAESVDYMLALYARTSNDESELINTCNTLVSNSPTVISDEFSILTDISDKGDRIATTGNLQQFISGANVSVSNQRSKINSLKATLLSAIG